jgi:hypothetical protein
MTKKIMALLLTMSIVCGILTTTTSAVQSVNSIVISLALSGQLGHTHNVQMNLKPGDTVRFNFGIATIPASSLNVTFGIVRVSAPNTFVQSFTTTLGAFTHTMLPQNLTNTGHFLTVAK